MSEVSLFVRNILEWEARFLSEIIMFQIVFSFMKYTFYTEIYISGKLHTVEQQ